MRKQYNIDLLFFTASVILTKIPTKSVGIDIVEPSLVIFRGFNYELIIKIIQ